MGLDSAQETVEPCLSPLKDSTAVRCGPSTRGLTKDSLPETRPQCPKAQDELGLLGLSPRKAAPFAFLLLLFQQRG